ncbi:MAG TPA: type II toxin-antitoxin system ParD family antitoxin [Lacipirellulaceae bacterium]|nr:type II toxin-antitoxin system ParD family antitoxin [Lacipirellulaceae bacterium]
MNYPLPSDLQERIQAQLIDGRYATEEDVLREAITSLEQREKGLSKLREMVREAEEDVATDRVGPFDRAAIKEDLRARLAERGIVD